ncbi:MAG: hypothetical protein Tp152SUR00d2C52646391_38 [Prokaryotic dsDNA virus sp.]|nr:MAG: hypothetical protein Tp152SUR00d2C52646391_38 [Prokaryotic dsDNA virus sp.]
MRNKVAVFATNGMYNQKVVLYHLHKKQVITQISLKDYEALTTLRYQWMMYMAGFSVKKRSDGTFKHSLEFEAIQNKDPKTHTEMIDTFNSHHKTVLDTMNKGRLIGAGWIASINGHNLTNDQVMEIFTALGVYQEF